MSAGTIIACFILVLAPVLYLVPGAYHIDLVPTLVVAAIAVHRVP